MIRIVKMQFQADKVDDFKAIFSSSRHIIRSSEGCMHLELWQDKHDPTTFFTYSIWRDPEDLARYRYSPFFQKTWMKAKTLFRAKPEAWSVEQQDESIL